jgi:hypothetical protein
VRAHSSSNIRRWQVIEVQSQLGLTFGKERARLIVRALVPRPPV